MKKILAFISLLFLMVACSSTEKVVFDLIDGERTGAKLSPAFAMSPLSTVCGFYLCNDNAKY